MADTGHKSKHKSLKSPRQDHQIDYHKFDDENELEEIRGNLLKWFDRNQRDLPWRFPEVKNSNPHPDQDDEILNRRAYAIWVSEIMLQQTRVQTVIEYFQKWMKKWPTVQDLAKASLEEVNEMWSGLGYYRRARFLHEGAKMVCSKLNGKLPKTAKELEGIPGIGKYTAGAISSISFGEPSPLVDGNVIRVLSRVRAIGGDPTKKEIIKLHWELAGKLVDPDRPGTLNQSLMELGATVCTAQNPQCSTCPIQPNCHAYKAVQEHNENLKKVFTSNNSDIEDLASSSSSTNTSDCPICKEAENTPTESVTKYPQKVKKTSQREELVTVTVVEWRSEVSKYLLVQRPPNGLLASLWEFPQLPSMQNNNEDKDSDSEDNNNNNNNNNNIPSILNKDETQFIVEVQQRMEVYLKNLGFSELQIESRSHIGSILHLFSHIRQTLSVEWMQISTCKEEEEVSNGNNEATPKKKKKGKKDTCADSKPNTRWLTAAELEGAAISKSVKKCFALVEKHKTSSKSGKAKKRSSNSSPAKETSETPDTPSKRRKTKEPPKDNSKQSKISAFFNNKKN